MSKQDKLGGVEVTLAQIVSSPGRNLTRPLELDGKVLPKAVIKVTAEEISSSKQLARFRFSAKNLDKKDLFGKSDPYFNINRILDDGSKILVYRSKHVLKTLNPDWEVAQINLSTLCNGHVDRPLSIDVFDWDANSDHDLIGSFYTTVNELLTKKEFDVLNPKKKKTSGTFVVQSFVLQTIPTFLDYIAGGTQISLAVAIDFTASNGPPDEPTSLHYRQGGKMNAYEEAIYAVGTILEAYDTDKSYPATGFGAQVSGQPVSHYFPLNMNPQNPEVAGVAGIMETYQYALSMVKLYGPTNFAPTINALSSRIRTSLHTQPPGSNYNVLLIITDGEITDMAETIRAIVDASDLPLSIVIVGVGQAQFDAMNVLDADNGQLNSRGKVAKRDIVQFVAFRECRGNGEELARKVLAEIPDQLVGYMQQNNIRPRAPPTSHVPS
ncbi:Copine-5 [Rhizophlyctis rosea]|nr:Copine-5 [Rhizophlyctis rosea]